MHHHIYNSSAIQYKTWEIFMAFPEESRFGNMRIRNFRCCGVWYAAPMMQHIAIYTRACM